MDNLSLALAKDCELLGKIYANKNVYVLNGVAQHVLSCVINQSINCTLTRSYLRLARWRRRRRRRRG